MACRQRDLNNINKLSFGYNRYYPTCGTGVGYIHKARQLLLRDNVRCDEATCCWNLVHGFRLKRERGTVNGYRGYEVVVILLIMGSRYNT